MSRAPETIPFNIIDRSYLIPETEDVEGSYFPMSPITIFKLQITITKEQMISALLTLDDKHPQLRIAYQLDYKNLRWRHIPKAQLAQYLETCVHVLSDERPIESILSEQIALNNTPLSQPMQVFIVGQYLLFRMHHSFGDGRYFYLLLQLLLSELMGLDTAQIHLSNNWWKSIGSVIWDNFTQGTTVLWQFTRSLFGYYQDYQQDTQSIANSTRAPIKSASPMAVRFKTISPDCLELLNGAKQNLSLNTLLQVIIGEHLKRLNLQNEPITYTIPVDLRRYLHDATPYYPGNMASQIRVTLRGDFTLPERAAKLQTQITEQLDNKVPLASVPGEWLLLLSGTKNYQAVNRDWLLKSTYNDPRIFVMSNLGNLDSQFINLQDILADDFSPQIVIPLMGSPSLVFCFNTFRGWGNIVLTYDPQVHSETEIEAVLSLFEHQALKNMTQEIAN